MNRQNKFFLASICMFNFGAMILMLSGLNWLSWLIMATSIPLWIKGLTLR